LCVSSSEIARLSKQLKCCKEQYDGLRIRQLTRAGVEQDPTKAKSDAADLERFKSQIQKLEKNILEIKLDLK